MTTVDQRIAVFSCRQEEQRARTTHSNRHGLAPCSERENEVGRGVSAEAETGGSKDARGRSITQHSGDILLKVMVFSVSFPSLAFHFCSPALTAGLRLERSCVSSLRRC